jgi:hypothetical protein
MSISIELRLEQNKQAAVDHSRDLPHAGQLLSSVRALGITSKLRRSITTADLTAEALHPQSRSKIHHARLLQPRQDPPPARHAGGGPKTRAEFNPVKPNEFDIV